MGLRTILFVGDDQARIIADLYRDIVASARNEFVVYVPSFPWRPARLSSDLPSRVRICLQQARTEDALPPFRDDIEVYPFVRLTNSVLWPFNDTGETDAPAPSNSDSYLEGMRGRLPPDDLLAAYVTLDVAATCATEEAWQRLLAEYRRSDQSTGCSVASFLSDNIEDEQLFLRPDAPAPRLLAHVASGICRRLGASDYQVMLAAETRLALPLAMRAETPIHPGILTAMNLRYANAATRYHCSGGERLDFANYVRRYLYGGLLSVPPAGGIAPTYSAALAPLLGFAYAPPGADDQEERAIAVAIDLVESGDFAQAEVALADIAERCFDTPRYDLLVARIELGLHRAERAAAAAGKVTRVLPDYAPAQFLLGIALRRAGDMATAEEAARNACSADPLNANARNLLAELLEDRAQRAAARAVLKAGLAAECWNAQTFSLLGHFALRDGMLEEAEEAFLLGMKLDETREDLRESLLAVRQRQLELSR